MPPIKIKNNHQLHIRETKTRMCTDPKKSLDETNCNDQKQDW